MSDQPYARVDFYGSERGEADHILAQFQPGQRDRLLRALLHLVDNLKSAPGAFVQAVEVEQVRE